MPPAASDFMIEAHEGRGMGVNFVAGMGPCCSV
jgi:hypothetical protein